jgi:hypothetical protein
MSVIKHDIPPLHLGHNITGHATEDERHIISESNKSNFCPVGFCVKSVLLSVVNSVNYENISQQV